MGNCFCPGNKADLTDEKKRVKKAPHTFSNGATFSGEWIGDFRDGQGTQSWPDGAVYEGQWKADKAHG